MTAIISLEEKEISRDIASKLSQSYEIKFRDCKLIREAAHLTGKPIDFNTYYKVLEVIPYASSGAGVAENLTMIKVKGIGAYLSNLWFSKYKQF